MIRILSPLVVAVVAWIALGAAAQSRPDFSGRWTTDPDPAVTTPAPAGRGSTARGDMGSGWGPTITIAQGPTQLTVESAVFTRYDLQPPLKFVYSLDGSETRNTVMMGHGAQVQSSRTAWDGQKLIITSVHTLPDSVSGKPVTTEVIQSLVLESAMSLLVEVTRSGVLGGPSSTTRTIYRKL
jgi:hypothetical protein